MINLPLLEVFPLNLMVATMLGVVISGLALEGRRSAGARPEPSAKEQIPAPRRFQLRPGAVELTPR
ncbi:MAG: hypothetical protein GEU90_21505 [Gemmatimonas sp.]|nr:hypothetical protein [Gemmatimonas sp.]